MFNCGAVFFKHIEDVNKRRVWNSVVTFNEEDDPGHFALPGASCTKVVFVEKRCVGLISCL